MTYKLAEAIIADEWKVKNDPSESIHDQLLLTLAFCVFGLNIAKG